MVQAETETRDQGNSSEGKLHGHFHHIPGYTSLEQLAQDVEWERFRKPFMRRQFHEMGMSEEETEKAVGVVAYMEENAVTETTDFHFDPADGPIFTPVDSKPYKYAKHDGPDIQKIAGGVKRPIELLKNLDVVYDWQHLPRTFMGWTSLSGIRNVVETFGKRSRSLDILKRLKQSDIRLLKESEYYSEDEDIRDPFKVLDELPPKEYRQQLSDETLGRVKSLNEELVAILKRNNTRTGTEAPSQSALTADYIAAYLHICCDETALAMFRNIYKGQVEGIATAYDCKRLGQAVKEFSATITAMPDLVKLYTYGFDVHPYIPYRRNDKQLGEYRADMQKILGNDRLCKNAALLAKYGVHLGIENAASLDKEFYNTEDPVRFEQVLKIWDTYKEVLGFEHGKSGNIEWRINKNEIGIYSCWKALETQKSSPLTLEEVHEALAPTLQPEFIETRKSIQEKLPHNKPTERIVVSALLKEATSQADIRERINTLMHHPDLLMAIYDRDFLELVTNSRYHGEDGFDVPYAAWFKDADKIMAVYHDREAVNRKKALFDEYRLKLTTDIDTLYSLQQWDEAHIRKLAAQLDDKAVREWRSSIFSLSTYQTSYRTREIVTITPDIFKRADGVERMTLGDKEKIKNLFNLHSRYGSDVFKFCVYESDPQDLEALTHYLSGDWESFTQTFRRVREIFSFRPEAPGNPREITLTAYLIGKPEETERLARFVPATRRERGRYEDRVFYNEDYLWNQCVDLVKAVGTTPDFSLSQYISDNGRPTVAFVDFFTQRKEYVEAKRLLSAEAIAQFPESEQQFWTLWSKVDHEKLQTFLYENKENIPTEQLETYVAIWERIDKSPSQELKRVKDEIIIMIAGLDNPLEQYEKIEAVFVKNNLPLAYKVFKIFDILHPDQALDKELQESSTLSPVLRHASPRDRKYIIYQDLLDVHVESGNRSLKRYLEVLAENEDVLRRYDNEGAEGLNPDENRRLTAFVNRMEALSENSFFGRLTEPEQQPQQQAQEKLDNRIAALKERIGIEPGQPLTANLAEMYLQPLKYQTIDELLQAMTQAKQAAHERNTEIYQQAENGCLTIEAGSLIKGVGESYIGNILQNGSVAKEYLGASAGTDSTPYDTDVSIVLPQDLENVAPDQHFKQAIAKSFGGNAAYGRVLFVVKDHGQFYKTTDEEYERQDGTYELFSSGGDKHYGVRTGFPCTEVYCMTVLDDLAQDERKLEEVYYAIAQNGYYIPVTNTDGKVIFTPQMYDEYRHVFDGLAEFEGGSLTIDTQTGSSQEKSRIYQLVEELHRDSQRIDSLSHHIREKIETVLAEHDITLRDDESTGIIGAELYDIGSTGRHTNVTGDSDFDMTLTLDDKDTVLIDLLKKHICEAFESSLDQAEQYQRADGSDSQQLQLREASAEGITIALDVGFAKKSDLRVIGSHDAVKGKLDWIRTNLGEDTYFIVLANIVLAKQVLKAAHAYKKSNPHRNIFEGGLGGIGVENWVLANGGNFHKACESFLRAAYDENGQIRSLADFNRHYKIYDAGVNILHMSHDEFISRNLQEQGYQNMVTALSGYLKYGTEESN